MEFFLQHLRIFMIPFLKIASSTYSSIYWWMREQRQIEQWNLEPVITEKYYFHSKVIFWVSEENQSQRDEEKKGKLSKQLVAGNIVDHDFVGIVFIWKWIWGIHATSTP